MRLDSADLSIDHVVDNVRRRLAASTTTVNVYWLRVHGNRDAYCDQLDLAFAADPALVLVVRDVRFDDPNSVGSDFVCLLEKNRTLCENRLRNGSWETFAVILLSRTDLQLLQAASPATMPTWFTTHAGHSVQVAIEDLTWSTDAALDAQEVKVGDLAERLMMVEGALLRRLRTVHDTRKDYSSALLQLIRRNEAETFSFILDQAAAYRDSITNPGSFRPSRRNAESLVARLWSVSQETASDALTKPSKALALALQCSDSRDMSSYQTLHSVLRRPSSREPSVALRFTRSLLVSIGQTCQLLTAAAHADDYPRYPVQLLKSVSLDLRRTLAEGEQFLNLMD